MKKLDRTADRICRYCEFASTLQSDEEILCRKKGIVACTYRCHSFLYDPLKRNPGAPLTAPKLEYISLDETPDAP